MRKTFVTAAVLLMASPVVAEQSRALKLDPSPSSKSLPVKQPKADHSCAAYGAGFVKVAGTDTCMKIGGSISVGAGGTVRGR